MPSTIPLLEEEEEEEEDDDDDDDDDNNKPKFFSFCSFKTICYTKRNLETYWLQAGRKGFYYQ